MLAPTSSASIARTAAPKGLALLPGLMRRAPDEPLRVLGRGYRQELLAALFLDASRAIHHVPPRAVGFTLVDCFWKRLDLVLIGGYN
jgi:hypothetical protein